MLKEILLILGSGTLGAMSMCFLSFKAYDRGYKDGKNRGKWGV